MVVACTVMITADIEVKTKGILEEIKKNEIPIINGIRIVADIMAASGSGLKSKYCPFENGRVNIRISPTATIK